MPRIAPLQPSFNAGELSPRLAARVDFSKFAAGLETCLNLVPLAEGGLLRRAATRYVATSVLSQTQKSRVVPFQFSDEQAYVLELSATRMRFFRNQGIISVADTDASVSNGTFASGISGWTDNSTGSAAISHDYADATDSGTYGITSNGTEAFGDAAGAERKNIALQFVAGDPSGSARSVTVKTGTHTANGNVHVEIWTNNGVTNVPDSQTGGDSDTVSINAASTEFTFTWSSNAPTIASGNAYWVVLVNSDTSLNTTLETVTDQGASFASGQDDSAITDISDGSGSFPAGDDWRIRVRAGGTGALSLDGTAADEAIAEQNISHNSKDIEHVLRFRVIGAAGDKVKMQVGEQSGSESDLAAREYGVGYHAIAFTPATASTYIQFILETTAKSVLIDDVVMRDDLPLELTTPWAAADIFQLSGPQTADVKFFYHNDYPPYKLIRYGHSSWSLEEVEFLDGPYLDTNTTATTIDPSATTGLGITFTASAVEGINGGQGFLSTDVGRLIRIEYSSEWGYAVITQVVNTLTVIGDVKRDFGAHTAEADWRLGAWSETTGYPKAAAFYEQRLFSAGTTDQPQTIWASQTGDFENYRPDSAASGGGVEVQKDDAFDYTLSADDVNAIQWVSAGEDTLAIGTLGGEWVPESEGAVLEPNDISVRRQTTHGSADVQPIRVDNVVLFVQRAGRKIREFGFSFNIDGYNAPDMTRLAYHITRGGIVEMAYAQEPNSIVWLVRGDGSLLSMTYRREEDVVGWSLHRVGGSFGSGNAVVESICAIPGNDGSGQTNDSSDRDEVWVSVKRTINGATARYIEFMEQDYDAEDDQEDAYYADSLITYDSSSATTITGLDHLEGETVGIWADGGIQADKTVNSGSITLDNAASVAQIGLRYTHRLKTLRMEGGNPAGTALGRPQRIYDTTFFLLNAHSMKYGPDTSNLKEIFFRDVGDAGDAAAPLFTGQRFVPFEGGWTADSRIIVESDDPAPFTLLAVAPSKSLNPLK